MNLEKIRNIFKGENISKIINVSLIILIGIAGYFFYINSKKSNVPKSSTAAATAPETIVKKLVVVDIAGAVKKPGVYDLDSESRIIDAIEKAGGFTDTADQKFIDKNINKAQRLTDGIKIYIPVIGETIEEPSTSTSPTTPAGGIVSINTGSRIDLINLPEIGEVSADKIIASRPFNSLQELVTKGCIKQSSLDKIKDQISL